MRDLSSSAAYKEAVAEINELLQTNWVVKLVRQLNDQLVDVKGPRPELNGSSLLGLIYPISAAWKTVADLLQLLEVITDSDLERLMQNKPPKG